MCTQWELMVIKHKYCYCVKVYICNNYSLRWLFHFFEQPYHKGEQECVIKYGKWENGVGYTAAATALLVHIVGVAPNKHGKYSNE